MRLTLFPLAVKLQENIRSFYYVRLFCGSARFDIQSISLMQQFIMMIKLWHTKYIYLNSHRQISSEKRDWWDRTNGKYWFFCLKKIIIVCKRAKSLSTHSARSVKAITECHTMHVYQCVANRSLNSIYSFAHLNFTFDMNESTNERLCACAQSEKFCVCLLLLLLFLLLVSNTLSTGKLESGVTKWKRYLLSHSGQNVPKTILQL